MDNNMINIDDLFRQRLGNAEEEQRPGSWLRMKELLDEQMPAAGNSWRRMLYATAGVLLLSTITVGSYQAYTAFRGDNISDDVKAKYAAHDPAAGAVGAVMNYADGKPVVARNGQAIISDTDNDVNTTNNTTNTNAIVSGGNGQATTSSANAYTTTGSSNGIGNGQNVSNNSSNISETIRNNSTNTTVPSNGSNGLDNSTLTATTSRANASANVSDNSNSVTSGNNSSATSNNEQQDVVDAQMAAITNNIQNLYNSGRSNATSADATNISNAANGGNVKDNTLKSTNNTNGTGGTDNNGVYALNSSTSSNNDPKGNGTQPVQPKKPNDGQATVAQKNKDNTSSKGYRIDSVNKIEMREYVTSNGTTVLDTVDVGKVPVRKKINDVNAANDLVAANDNRTDADKDNVIIPNADLQLQTEDGNGVYKPLVPNSAAPKTANSKKYYNNNRFDEMVKNAKLKLKGVKFYPGVVAGANMAMTQNGFTGFQLGVNGNLSFGNRWSLYSELKYMQRFNGGKDLRDDYNTGLDSFVSQAGVKVYTYDSVEHFFNFTNVSTIEMPIALKYNIKRFNVFGGVNLNYNLAINNDEIERPYAVTKTETSLSSGQLNYGLLRGKPTVSSADFSSRFTVGYLFGMSYEMSPAMQLDLRVTQPIWDNAKTSGEQTVTKELFNAPTLQFNMSYRFSQKPYKKFRQ